MLYDDNSSAIFMVEIDLFWNNTLLAKKGSGDFLIIMANRMNSKIFRIDFVGSLTGNGQEMGFILLQFT